MAMPIAFNPISLGQLQTEFGGANPISISEYYRGGAYTTNNNTNVPTGGTIALSNFYSAYRAYPVIMDFSRSANLQNAFYLDSPGFARITITTTTNGGTSIITYPLPTNVIYTITANVGNDRIRQNGNGMQLEDLNDFDWNDLEWYPRQGTVYSSGGNFYYVLNI